MSRSEDGSLCISTKKMPVAGGALPAKINREAYVWETYGILGKIPVPDIVPTDGSCGDQGS